MIRAGSAEDASCKGHSLTILFIHIFKIFVSQKGFFVRFVWLHQVLVVAPGR